MPNAPAKTPPHLWIVGALSLLWNAFGAGDFSATVSNYEPYLAGFPQAARDYIAAYPGWAFAVWGLATWGAVLGSALLLLRRAIAAPVLLLSFAAACVTMAYSYALNPGPAEAQNLPFSLLILTVALGLWFYARAQQRGGVLR